MCKDTFIYALSYRLRKKQPHPSNHNHCLHASTEEIHHRIRWAVCWRLKESSLRVCRVLLNPLAQIDRVTKRTGLNSKVTADPTERETQSVIN